MVERDEEVAALKRRIAELEDSEQRFRTICENAPVMINAFDSDGRVTLWNRESERCLGFTLEDLATARDPLSILIPDAAERDRARDSIQCAEGVFHEYHTPAKDGTERITMWADFRLPTGAVISVGYDVTEQRKIELHLRRTQKLDALGQLTGGIAHDFNNLLTVMMTNAELIRRRARMAESDFNLVDQVQAAARRGAELVRKLLAFSRSEMLELRPVDVVAEVRELVPTLRRLLPETIAVEVHAEEPVPLVRADVAAIEQMIVNLATNARDAMVDGGTLTVDVRSVGDSEVHVVVRDDGLGMAPETSARACEPFYSTKASGRGTGLGLAIVYGLMGQHDGRVEIDSVLGDGTEVTLAFRRAAATAAVAAKPPVVDAGAARERVLVVEDEAPIRAAACAALEEAGYDVASATDGQHALAVLREIGPVALVVSDVVMPKMSGPQLRDALDPATRPPFLFTTGYAPGPVLAKAGIRGEAHLLRKPWTASELLAAVRLVLDESG